MIIELEENEHFSIDDRNYSQFNQQNEKDNFSDYFESTFNMSKSVETEIDDYKRDEDESIYYNIENKKKFINNVDIKKNDVIVIDSKEIDKNLIFCPQNNISDFKIFNKCSNEFYKLFQNQNVKQKKKSIYFLVSDKNNNEFENSKDTFYLKKKTKFNNEKKENTKSRKYKPDDIRKKIKSRFHKTLKNIINIKLEDAGSKEIFDFLPQSFVSNISREKNKEVMNMTYREILQNDFCNLDKKKSKKKKVKKNKFKRNIKVLNYLDLHKDILEKSGFNKISEMTYLNILKEYFLSKEFELSVEQLKLEKESVDYINEYLIKAKSYISFFMDK